MQREGATAGRLCMLVVVGLLVHASACQLWRGSPDAGRHEDSGWDGGRDPNAPPGRWMVLADAGIEDINLFDAWGTDSINVYVVGDEGAVYHLGETGWHRQESYTAENLRAIWGSGAEDIFAVGFAGAVIHYGEPPEEGIPDCTTPDGGVNQPLPPDAGVGWYPQCTWNSDNLHDVWGSSPNDVYAVGDNGTILHYDGTAWEKRQSCFELEGCWYRMTARFHGVWGVGGSVYVMGEKGSVLRYERDVRGEADPCPAPDGGVLYECEHLWSMVEDEALQTHNFLEGVWGYGPGNMLIVGLSGTALHFNAGSWEELEGAPLVFLRAIWGDGEGNIFIVGWNGTIVYYDGLGFRQYDNIPDVRLEGVWGTSKKHVLVVGASGTILLGTCPPPLDDRACRRIWGEEE